ncbi:MOSC domain-containing protein [Lutimaribacter pacificus]|uniref:MOSC domain-containing protein n=1 Tax=Lutimaribacter pacificus TaxID=391948 RepID=A0A1H0BTD1_9RHOB|nr:MOSC domain-containing protein [Lutimaribacter pacificus]SDN48835.1 MOSC domain-containing protein [Lutimaribacter pacificus]SHJ52378.1 MOSC domain-containing protein [Lutimaribacter pacificus]
MPALIPTDFSATVTWLGVVESDDRTALIATPRDALELRFEGLAGSVHGGRVRASCSRVVAQHPRGTPIANERQLSILSEEELARVATEMGLDALDPARLGASIVMRGLPDLSLLPPSSRLQGPDGATLVVDMQNRPCHLPARSIETVEPSKGRLFKRAADGRRGVTAWVQREGRIALGDTLRLHIPDQPAWPHLEAARGC